MNGNNPSKIDKNNKALNMKNNCYSLPLSRLSYVDTDPIIIRNVMKQQENSRLKDPISAVEHIGMNSTICQIYVDAAIKEVNAYCREVSELRFTIAF